MLRVVPYAVRHPGTRLAELAELFDVPESELIQDLDLLFVTGVPPYGPGDLVDVEIEDGRVWISMADHLSRPVRLTRDEALALYLRATAVAGTPGLPESEALGSALAKIEAGLGEEALGGLAGRVERADEASGGAPGALEVTRRAAERGEQLRIEYYSASRDQVRERVIEPEQVFAAVGHWYVVAWDVEADAERMFRADRIRQAEPTGARFERRGLAGAGRPLYSRTDADRPVTLLLGPGGRWVAEYYEVESSREIDGTLQVTLPTKDLAWVAKLVLRLGPDGEVVEPEGLRELVARLVDETLAAYR